MTTEASPAASALDSSFLLAVERTRLAHERTLIAWQRTAFSMISFGFTIYKFFQFELARGLPQAGERLLSPRIFALIMIAIGLLAQAMALVQHRQSMKRLRAESGIVIVPVSIATVVSALFTVLGVLSFLAVLFRA
jgi:inner membrane protein YidH